ncbi:SAV_2336 N-terminal domain-related protein [uncultured Lamprocystis sp.]|jgi:hypothetical protein|uniref:SAV_2336 N-terminal domain-related protein n=1 Tax=uncultured Lamprocystis sp. TaxID=543132 RepID=UPI0025ED0F8E|nr:SAV_2336 N-terminal domain-related protein [uncultured Lamprocystis sp.]
MSRLGALIDAIYAQGVYSTQPAAGASQGAGSKTIRVARPRLLADPLGIGRALRPLRQRVPSRTRRFIDEAATVHNFAELGLPIPVLRGIPERRLELALIVDALPVFILWEPLLHELARLFARHGAFRDLRIWRIGADADHTTRLWPGLHGGSPRPPGILHDPQGRRAVLVLSDFSDPAWRRGFSPHADRAPWHLDALAEWERRQPVALLQLLPQIQWRRTALGEALLTRLRGDPRGSPDEKVRLIPEMIPGQGKAAPDSLTLPVITSDAVSLAAWSRLLSGRAGAWVPGAQFPRTPLLRRRPIRQPEPPGPRERLQRFKAGASAPARELARTYAAMPLTLPVVRLVQQTCCADQNPAYLAELFLGGLLQRTEEQPSASPQPLETVYDYPAGVRQLLIDTLHPDEIQTNLRRVSDAVRSQLGAPYDFLARYLDPALPATADDGAGPRFKPFARIRLQVLRRLGGCFGPEAKRLSDWIDSPPRAAACDLLLIAESDLVCDALLHLYAARYGRVADAFDAAGQICHDLGSFLVSQVVLYRSSQGQGRDGANALRGLLHEVRPGAVVSVGLAMFRNEPAVGPREVLLVSAFRTRTGLGITAEQPNAFTFSSLSLAPRLARWLALSSEMITGAVARTGVLLDRTFASSVQSESAAARPGFSAHGANRVVPASAEIAFSKLDQRPVPANRRPITHLAP